MVAAWVEKVTGSLEHKRSYRAYKARIGELPENYRAAVQALDRYFMYFGGMSDGETIVRMLDDLASLFEQAAAESTPIRLVVGEDPVEFAEDFLANYSEGQWIAKEKRRLVASIDAAAREGGG
jgi:DNA-binding ferritin-like protein (Dps family)